MKPRMLLRSLEVRDARNMGCLLKEAAHDGQSLSEEAAVWAITVKTGGAWLPKPLGVHILPLCTTISDMETWIFPAGIWSHFDLILHSNVPIIFSWIGGFTLPVFLRSTEYFSYSFSMTQR